MENEGCGCYFILVIIGIIAFIGYCVSDHDASTTTSKQSYTTKPVSHVSAPTYTPPPSYNPPVPTAVVEYDSSSDSLSPDDAYDEGYDDGYEQGLEDARHGRSEGYGYDDSTDFYGYYETKYCDGYEDGYADGYEEGSGEYLY